MLSTPPVKSGLGKAAAHRFQQRQARRSVNENARPRASTHWIRSAAAGPGCSMLRIRLRYPSTS